MYERNCLRKLFGRASIRVTDGLIQGDSISGYASSRLGSQKNVNFPELDEPSINYYAHEKNM